MIGTMSIGTSGSWRRSSHEGLSPRFVAPMRRLRHGIQYLVGVPLVRNANREQLQRGQPCSSRSGYAGWCWVCWAEQSCQSANLCSHRISRSTAAARRSAADRKRQVDQVRLRHRLRPRAALRQGQGRQGPPGAVWPDAGEPTNLRASTDLMLLHPDGSEEVLVAGGKGAIADPFVSFDGEWVYYAYFHDAQRRPRRRRHLQGPRQDAQGRPPDAAGVHAEHRRRRLVEDCRRPNGKAASTTSDPCPLPGGRLVFVSNRNGFKAPRGYAPTIALQLFVMDDDGNNVERIGHLNLGLALHPVILKDGRIMFSSLEVAGAAQPPAGASGPSIPTAPTGTRSSAPSSSAARRSVPLPDAALRRSIVVEEYYNLNNGRLRHATSSCRRSRRRARPPSARPSAIRSDPSCAWRMTTAGHLACRSSPTASRR